MEWQSRTVTTTNRNLISKLISDLVLILISDLVLILISDLVLVLILITPRDGRLLAASYPGTGPYFGFVVAALASRRVIHSLWIITLRGRSVTLRDGHGARSIHHSA
jgi:hypothetical protein